jgi:hypothetical protein
MSHQDAKNRAGACPWCGGSGRIAPGVDCGPCRGGAVGLRPNPVTSVELPSHGLPIASEHKRGTALVLVLIVMES